jgi:hypothetical protein
MQSTRFKRALRRATLVLFMIAAQMGVPHWARAQDAGKVGLVLRAPQSVGVIINATDGFALVPSIDIAWQSSRSNIHGVMGNIPPGALTIDHSQLGATLTLAARIRVASSGDTSVYVAPSVSWSLTSSEDSVVSTASTEDDIAGGGHLGVQHALNDRLSIFGEVGVRYRQYDISTSVGTGLTETTTYKSVNTSSAVGIVYYFKR